MQLEVIGINDGFWGTRPKAQKVDSQDRSRQITCSQPKPAPGPVRSQDGPGTPVLGLVPGPVPGPVWSWDWSHDRSDWSKPVPGSSPGVTAGPTSNCCGATSNRSRHLFPPMSLFLSQVPVGAPTALFLGPAPQRDLAQTGVRLLTDELPSV